MYPMYSPVVTIPNGAERNGCFPSVGEAKALLLLDSSLVDLLEQPDVFPSSGMCRKEQAANQDGVSPRIVL